MILFLYLDLLELMAKNFRPEVFKDKDGPEIQYLK